MARVMIFGSSGRSGQAMVRTARERGHETITPTHAECDLLQAEQAAETVRKARADIVINCAAISGLEACADNAEAARTINAKTPAAIAAACRRIGATFVHLSTDYVLEGDTPGLKDETTPCAPICAYGQSKLEGERLIAEANAAGLILRVSWLCGNPERPGFPESIAMKALAGQPLAAIDDKDSLPTDVHELAHAALQLAERKASGTYHICSTGAPVTWWQNATLAVQTLVEEGALPQAPAITAQKLDAVPFFREPRPRHTAMDNTKLRAHGICMSSAQDTIRRAVRNYLALSVNQAKRGQQPRLT